MVNVLELEYDCQTCWSTYVEIHSKNSSKPQWKQFHTRSSPAQNTPVCQLSRKTGRNLPCQFVKDNSEFKVYRRRGSEHHSVSDHTIQATEAEVNHKMEAEPDLKLIWSQYDHPYCMKPLPAKANSSRQLIGIGQQSMTNLCNWQWATIAALSWKHTSSTRWQLLGMR